MLDVLYKKARGYDVEETTREFVVDEEGVKRMVKEKVTVKHVQPDLAALKAYTELRDTELAQMSDEELASEMERLLKEWMEKEKKQG